MERPTKIHYFFFFLFLFSTVCPLLSIWRSSSSRATLSSFQAQRGLTAVLLGDEHSRRHCHSPASASWNLVHRFSPSYLTSMFVTLVHPSSSAHSSHIQTQRSRTNKAQRGMSRRAPRRKRLLSDRRSWPRLWFVPIDPSHGRDVSLPFLACPDASARLLAALTPFPQQQDPHSASPPFSSVVRLVVSFENDQTGSSAERVEANLTLFTQGAFSTFDCETLDLRPRLSSCYDPFYHSK